MISDLLTAFAVVSLASAFIGACIEYSWHAVRHGHKHDRS